MGFASGVDPTAVHSSASFKLGTVAWDHAGRAFQYVEFDEDNDAFEAAIIHDDFGAEPIETTESAAGTGQGKQVGVPLVDFVTGEFGWVCRYGSGSDIKVFVEASCAAFTLLNTTGTDGSLDDDASTGAEEIPGLVVTTAAGGQKETELAVLNWPYVGLTIPA